MNAETKGERARQILENEVYQEAVQGARQRLKDQWSNESSGEARERLWLKLKAIDAVTNELAIIRDRGIVERNKNERKERQSA